MKRWMLLLAVALLAAALTATVRATDLTRFSQVLTAEQRAATGLDQLTSDQLAVLDALVRHDDAYAVPSTPAHPRPAHFSQRLSADERRNAGLTRLSPDQLARLDALVEQRVPLRVPFVAPAAGATTPAVEVERVRPQIHGSVTLGMGWGSGGYSEMGGSMVVDYYDPAHNLDLLLGYSEVHTKGPVYYRNCPDGFLPRR
jgi:2-oxo-4-hydroxy-4-carboxy--5-ureidoimidazoline (OHCU) decarboxylase